MSLTFEQARNRVPGSTASHGYEDKTHFLVIVLTDRDTDLVTLVDKATGKITEVPWMVAQEKKLMMTPISLPT